MHRRSFIKSLSCAALPYLAGCGYMRLDKWNVLLRSDKILSLAQEAEITQRARVEWSEDKRMRVLYVKGSPYDRGYQQGALLRKEIEENIGYLYRQALRKFPIPELFDEVYERMSPYISEEHREEMRGLAHGARLPLRMIQHIHILPDIGEWGGKKRLMKIAKGMMNGEPPELWGTSCSNFCVSGDAAAQQGFYTVRILDWGLHRISRLHEYPLLTVGVPETGVPYCNIGWVGFLGAVSGMNAEGITLGEMGYGDPQGEVLNGVPLCFMLRDVLTYSRKLEDARKIIKETIGTNSYIFLISDGKSRTSEMYIKDRSRFLVYKAGEEIKEEKKQVAPIDNILYGGHYLEKMNELLTQHRGSLDPTLIMSEIIPQIGMKSNFQNVVYDPVHLRFWVSNAEDTDSRAAEAPYTAFDFGAALKS